MKRLLNRNEGTIILETSIVLPIFFFVILGVYGLFGLTSVRNQMGHALIQSSKSLSMDPYILDQYESLSEFTSARTVWNSLSDLCIDIRRAFNDRNFSSYGSWHAGSGDDAIAKKRFVGFLSNGDEDEANERLKGLGIVNGLDGVKFKMSIKDNDMTIKISYEVKFLFDVFGNVKVKTQQSVTSRLWK